MEGDLKRTKEGRIKAQQIVYYILGILEVLFAFRLVLKLLGANPYSGFVSFIYAVTQVFLAPFSSIFRSGVTQGNMTQGILEPSTIIGMIVYAIIAWGIVKLIDISMTPKA
ncbi:MAG: YggT family protein [Thermincola sp.]|nr:YggT family protein [Thermincola sp.]MDT3702616.1 YggT family protein [Thermincola sp.]